MPRQQGYYSLVQYCPDPARAEVANVGVLLFSPGHDFIDVRLSRGVQHVKSVFKGRELDAAQIRHAKRALKDRVACQKNELRTLDNLKHFISLRFNTVLLTAPRSIAVEDPPAQLESLFQELVGPESKRRSMPRPYPELETFFRQPEIAPSNSTRKSSFPNSTVRKNALRFHQRPDLSRDAPSIHLGRRFRIMGEEARALRNRRPTRSGFNVLPEWSHRRHPQLRGARRLDGLKRNGCG